MAKSGVHAGKQDKRCRCGHDAESAKLHEDDDEPVANIGECGGNIDDGEPGDADGRHGGEKRFDKAYRAGACLGQT